MKTIYTKKMWILFACLELTLLSVIITIGQASSIERFDIFQLALAGLIIPLFIFFEGRRIILHRSIPKTEITKVIDNMKSLRILFIVIFIGLLSLAIYALVVEGSYNMIGVSYMYMMFITMNPRIVVTNDKIYYSAWIIEKDQIDSFKVINKNSVRLIMANDKTLPVTHSGISQNTYELIHKESSSQESKELICE